MTGVRVFAPASVANLGVGFDLLGAALDGEGDVVEARLVEAPGVALESVSGDGGRLPRESERNTASVAAAAVLARFPGRARGRGIALRLSKGLPLSSGLGSSAASAAAGAFAAAALLGVEDRFELLAAGLLAEHAADGSWHGDNVFASLLGGLLLVPSSDADAVRPPIPLPYPESLRLVLVHPELELRTADARAVLPGSISLGQHVRQGAALAELVVALFRGDLAAAGRAMDADRIVEPARAPLVRGHGAVTRAAREAGAFGCCLAGAGPSIVALSEEGPLPEAIARAAVEAWGAAGVPSTARVHRIDRDGARVVAG